MNQNNMYVIYVKPSVRKITCIKDVVRQNLVLDLEAYDREEARIARAIAEGIVVDTVPKKYFADETPPDNEFPYYTDSSSEDNDLNYSDEFDEDGYGVPLTREQRRAKKEDRKEKKESAKEEKKESKRKRKNLWTAFHRKLKVTRQIIENFPNLELKFSTSKLGNLADVKFIFFDYDFDGEKEMIRILNAIGKLGVENKPKLIALYSFMRGQADLTGRGVDNWVMKNDVDTMKDEITAILTSG